MERLRFKDDNGNEFPEWKSFKIKEIAILKSGSGFPEKYQGNKKGFPFYKVSDMNSLGNEKYMRVANNYLYLENSSKYKPTLHSKNSIIFAKVGAALLKDRKRILFYDSYIDNNLMALKLKKDFSPIYLYFKLMTLNLGRYAQVGALPSFGAKDIYPIKLLLSQSIDEQEKIGGFLSAFDRLIEKQREKVELLKKSKKGYTQQIFDRTFRFKGENGNDFPDWEITEFTDVFSSVSSRNYQIKNNEFLKSGLYPVVDQSENIISGYTNDSSKLFDNLPVVIFGDHTTVVKYIDFPFIVGADGTKILKVLRGIPLFQFYNLTKNNVKQEGYKRHFSILKRKFLAAPSSLKEQEKIGEFLNAMDNLIKLEENRLNNYIEKKKGYLQRLFANE